MPLLEKVNAMAEDGSDGVIAHLGLTTKGSIGATTATILEEAPARVQGLSNTAINEFRRSWAA